MQHQTEVLFSGGMNILGKGERAQTIIQCLVIPHQRLPIQALVLSPQYSDKDQCVVAREIEAEIGIRRIIVHHILTEHLLKKKVAEWWVPHVLTDTQKQTCLEITREHLKRFRREGENFLNLIIAVEETGIWDYVPELKI